MLIQFMLQFPISVFNSDGQLMAFLNLITPYIRMLSSDWLMKGVYFFFYQFLVFSAFPPLRGYLPKYIIPCILDGLYKNNISEFYNYVLRFLE